MVESGHALGESVRRRCVVILLTWLMLSLLLPCAAAPQDESDFNAQLNQWQMWLGQASAALKSDFAHADMAVVEDRLKKVIEQAHSISGSAGRRLDVVRKQLKKLGEPPGKEAPSEPTAVTRLREDLQQRVAEARAQSMRAELVAAKAQDLLNAIAEWKQARVRARILQRSPPSVSWDVWRQAWADGLAFIRDVVTSPVAWWQERQQQDRLPMRLLWILLLPVIGVLVGWPIRRYIVHHFGRDPAESDPGHARRLLAACADGVANAVMPVVIILLAMAVLAWLGVLSGLFAYLVYAIATASAAFLTVYGLARAALSPQLVQWRIVPVEPAYARALLRAVGTVIALLAFATVLLATAWTSDHLTPQLEAVFYLIQATITAAALFWLLTPKYWASSIVASQRLGTAAEHAEVLETETEGEADAVAEVGEPRWLRLVRALRWLVLLTPFLALAGYGRLTFHLQSRLVATGALIGIGLLLRLSLHEALEHILAGRRRRRRRRRGGGQETSVKVTVFWAGLGIDILLLVPLVYVLLLVYGVPLSTLMLWSQQLLEGITIGSITISLADVLIALVVLVAGIFATNLVRRWTVSRLLPNTKLDSGARDSIAAGTSYIGVGLAIVLAIAALGIDFSNLALIAGALSLGIGFGLQNVVQNFAAGILLLIERPIKVGDWVVVGTTEGTVKHISVRSTEIETFNRSSVFVPNSDLIANNVTNWTHTTPMARLILPVHVAHGSDPRQVEQVLLRCAREQPHVLRFPESYVWFRGFGDWALKFELRVYMDNADNWVIVDSGLYFAIEAALREAGIIIPFPQRDVHMRSDEATGSRLERGAAPDDAGGAQPAPAPARQGVRPPAPGGEAGT